MASSINSINVESIVGVGFTFVFVSWWSQAIKHHTSAAPGWCQGFGVAHCSEISIILYLQLIDMDLCGINYRGFDTMKLFRTDCGSFYDDNLLSFLQLYHQRISSAVGVAGEWIMELIFQRCIKNFQNCSSNHSCSNLWLGWRWVHQSQKKIFDQYS
jgi:hypothetical protein